MVSRRAGRGLAALAAALFLIVTFAFAGWLDVAPAVVLALVLVTGAVWVARVPVLTVHDRPGEVPPDRIGEFAEVLDALPDPVILLDGGRLVVAANRLAHEILGTSPVGLDLAASLRHPGALEAVDAVLGGAARGEADFTIPVPVVRAITLYAARLSPDSPLWPARAVLVLDDTTETKRTQEAQADFVANASHELRSPLSSLIGYIETLQGHARDDEAARGRFLEIMHGEARRMARLIGDLLSLSRVEIDEHVPARGTVDLAAVLGSVANTLAAQADARSMTIDVDCPEGLPPAAGDRDQLTQVFHNLVDNAVKYGRAHTPIRVTVRPVDRLPDSGVPGLAIAVADQGDGIPREHLPRLTERFYRIDKGRSRDMGGTGLGLAIVERIVARHRGRLAIDSTVGRGSTFTVTLPAGDRHRPSVGPLDIRNIAAPGQPPD